MVNMKSLCENISKQTHGKIPKFSRNITEHLIGKGTLLLHQRYFIVIVLF